MFWNKYFFISNFTFVRFTSSAKASIYFQLETKSSYLGIVFLVLMCCSACLVIIMLENKQEKKKTNKTIENCWLFYIHINVLFLAFSLHYCLITYYSSLWCQLKKLNVFFNSGKDNVVKRHIEYVPKTKVSCGLYIVVSWFWLGYG